MATGLVDDGLARYLQSGNANLQQAEMMEEPLIYVDEHDNPIGSTSKLTAHRFPGLLHRAFSVLLFNRQGRLLIQKRSSSKVTFPGYWANTCCSHPRSTAAERVETQHMGVKRAAVRKMEQELGIPEQALNPESMVTMTRLHYRAIHDSHWVEEEMDYILLLVADVEPVANPDEVETVRWVDQGELQAMLSGHPDKIKIAPWFRIITEEFLPGWWPYLGDRKKLHALADMTIQRRF
ncbi:MAG: isopentenyl-diphosphate delta-isomerase [Endozoicomonas sp.]